MLPWVSFIVGVSAFMIPIAPWLLRINTNYEYSGFAASFVLVSSYALCVSKGVMRKCGCFILTCASVYNFFEETVGSRHASVTPNDFIFLVLIILIPIYFTLNIIIHGRK